MFSLQPTAPHSDSTIFARHAVAPMTAGLPPTADPPLQGCEMAKSATSGPSGKDLPGHAQANIALQRDPLLSADRTQIARIGVAADRLRQLAGDAAAALQCGAVIALHRDGSGREGDKVGAVSAEPDIAFEVGLPDRGRAAKRAAQQSADPACQRLGVTECDRRNAVQSVIDPQPLPDRLRLRLKGEPRRE